MSCVVSSNSHHSIQLLTSLAWSLSPNSSLKMSLSILPLPPFLPSSLPPFLPSSLPPFLPSSLPPFLPFSLSPFLPFSLPPFLPSSSPFSLSSFLSLVFFLLYYFDDIRYVVCDTSFHSTLPDVAFRYAVPDDWYTELKYISPLLSLLLFSLLSDSIYSY